jgi:hypothetical protein
MRQSRTRPARKIERKIERKTLRPARFADSLEPRIGERKVTKRRVLRPPASK